ncbi:hypothetical protein [Longirhabdus pacifica]|uniref:hypothetical protein n=1 Tax=Longirhabdus pacifica TaxID=2305227 RepID=UPI001008B907|nr:hypothetical protein [Longirhabdus pacifica]
MKQKYIVVPKELENSFDLSRGVEEYVFIVEAVNEKEALRKFVRERGHVIGFFEAHARELIQEKEKDRFRYIKHKEYAEQYINYFMKQENIEYSDELFDSVYEDCDIYYVINMTEIYYG